jgi:3-hydroxymyristoyl/3-hydroxydecanoyl-(acyl carrier protein) dehydratase
LLEHIKKYESIFLNNTKANRDVLKRMSSLNSEILNKWIKESKNILIVEPIDISIKVQNIIPHRDKMLLIDNLCQITKDKYALKANVKIKKDDPVFYGHFPGDPVYPGVLLVEAISQAGVCLVKLVSQDKEYKFDYKVTRVRAIKILYAEFIREVKPGDLLDINVKIFEVTPFLSIFGGCIVRDNKVCAIAIVEVYLGE